MSYEISRKAASLSAYAPTKGDFDIHLDANESYFSLSEEALNRFLEKAREIAFNRYPDETEKKLISAFSKRYGLREECVCAGNGSDELITVIIGGLLERGGKILTAEPDFSMYRQNGKIAEQQLYRITKDEDFSFSVLEAAEIINREKIDCFIFSNPCNPTGGEIKKEDVLYLVRNTNALIVADEAYMEFSSGENSVLKEAQEEKGLIVLKTLSKAYSLAGARIGFAVCEKETALSLNSIRSPYNINSLSQILGAIVLESGEELDRNFRNIKIQTNRLFSFLERENLSYIEKVFPTKGNFVFLKPKDSKALWEALAKRKIAVRLMDKYIRISAPSPLEEEALFSALKEIEKEI